MSNNQLFEDTMDNINNIAYGLNFKNGIEWADAARRAREIDWVTFKKYENAHNLRVRFSHGNARDINVSNETLAIAREFEMNISRSRIKGGRYNKRKDGPKLPDGTFRFTKEFNWDGANGRKYYFRFVIVEEYQKRAYDDGTRFSGTGYTIYVKNAPYYDWCLSHNEEYEFHFYAPRDEEPSICWNKLVTNFQDANAVMFVWAKRYVRILDQLLDSGSLSLKHVEKARRSASLPTGTFRKDFYKPRKVIHIKQKVYDEIMETLGKGKPELGGMLGWKDDQDYIDFFIFDKNAVVGHSEYSPDTKFLTSVLNGEWADKRIYLGGFVHSHPGNANRLSSADIEYAQRIMIAFDLKYLFMPIVTSSYAYKTTFNPYIVNLSGYVNRCDLEIIKEEEASNPDMSIDEESGVDIDAIEREFAKLSHVKPIYGQKEELSDDSLFARISTTIDIPYMKSCSVIGIGCGGGKSFYESMARVGVGHFYLFDGDVSSLSNVSSQNGYLNEVGMYKVDALKNRLLNINADVDVKTFNFMLNNEIDDAFLEEHVLNKIDRNRTVLCAFTDDFYAQARASRIALKYKIPFICGQHHAKGLSSELVFWYPGVTKYSLREIAKSRYESYKEGYKNTVTSVGSPVFNTTRLNALCEKIATGLLLYGGYPNHIYSRFIPEMADKNLILIRQCVLDEKEPLYGLLDNSINSFFDDVSWINPECIEDLDGTLLEEEIIEDTRKIF